MASAIVADTRTRTLGMVAALAPDLDWAPLLWGGSLHNVHRVVGHNVWVGIPLAALLALFATSRLRAALALYLAFLTHMLWDLTFVEWPQKLLWPMSDRTFDSLGWEPFSLPHLASLAAVSLITVAVALRTGNWPSLEPLAFYRSWKRGNTGPDD